ncbi:hypothetical protein [[Eubacterium] cellulosolvens]
MKSGLSAGTIAGLIAGLFSAILVVIGRLIGLYGVFGQPTINALFIFSIGWIIITIIFGIVFGFIYEKFYYSIPGEGIKKGLCFGLMIYFIKDITAGTYSIYSGIKGALYGLSEWVALGINLIVIGVYMWPIYGIVLGYLYKKE